MEANRGLGGAHKPHAQIRAARYVACIAKGIGCTFRGWRYSEEAPNHERQKGDVLNMREIKQMSDKRLEKRPYVRPELNIKIIRDAASIMLCAGGNKDSDRGIRAYRDLLIATVRMRRSELRRRGLA